MYETFFEWPNVEMSINVDNTDTGFCVSFSFREGIEQSSGIWV
jgi:hypothetical protein